MSALRTIIRAFLTAAALLATIPAWADSADSAIERGKYLADAGDCVSCHTRPGGEPFSGGRPFATPFGTIYSSNITPDADTGIGNWAPADLVRAMHEGVAPGGKRLFPAFPYPSFTKVTDDDIGAIYAYLRTLTAVRYSPPSNSFLLRQRWGMRFWNALFFKPGRFVPDGARSEAWNRGAYLVEGLGHCGSCHTPRGTFMAEDGGHAFAGGKIDDVVGGEKLRAWSAVNLTSAKSGLAAWSVKDIADYLKTGISARAGIFGPMNDVVVNSTRQLTVEDLHAVAAFLKDLPASESAQSAPPTEMVATGAPIYKERCEKCHMPSGRGGIFNGPPLANSAIVRAENPASLINIVLYGPDTPAGISTGSWETMRGYGDALSDRQIADVINYIRGSWGNNAAKVNSSDVTSQR